MTIQEKWAILYKNKNKCQDNAKDKYIKSIFDKNLRSIVENSLNGSIAVSLYGKSQVGKTTFMLSFLKIKKEYIHDLEIALRGGREKGLSATSTAMVYRKSSDTSEKFKLKSSNKEWKMLNLKGLENELRKLRKTVEKNKCSTLSEVIIEFPKKYFENKDKQINVQICDLPGYGSTTMEEREHVNKVLKKYLPASSVVLVFVKANNISDVSDLFDNDVMDSIYGWKYFSKKYRLITTHSYSIDSVRREIDKLLNNKPSILEYYRKQAATKETTNVPEDVLIYPLEFGDTYRELQKEHQKILPIIDKIMDKFWEDLYKDINNISESGNQIQILRSIPQVIAKIKKEKSKEKDEKIKSKKNECVKFVSKVKNISNNIENKKVEEENDREVVSKLKKNCIFETSSEYKGELNRDDMSLKIETIKQKFIEQKDRIVNVLNNKNFNIPFNKIEEFDENSFFNFIQGELKKIKYNKPFHNKYLKKIKGPQDKHKTELNNALENYNLGLTKLNEEISNSLESYLKSKTEQNKKKIIELKNYKTENEDKIKAIKKEIEGILNNKKEKESFYNSEIKRASKINDLLWNEVMKEKENIIENFNKFSRTEALIQIFYYALILSEAKKQFTIDT